MLLESLEVHNWRNAGGKIDWSVGLNVLHGDNGQGKTNWLEAIYLLATTKSFRTPKLQEAVLFDEDLSVVRGTVARSEAIKRELQVTLQGATKTLSVNGKRESAPRYLTELHAITFTSEDLEIVRGAPESRRRFLDRNILALHHSYVQTLADYNRVIKQKNRLLHDAKESAWTSEDAQARLEPWNSQLIVLGAQIHHARTDYVERLNDKLNTEFFGREQVRVRYASSLEGKGDLNDYESLIEARLKLRLEAEISTGYALIGTHRDDLEIMIDNRLLRTFGSSGQQRSALILLDLAALEVYYSWHREYPIFIMDDVDAELDARRVRLLLERLENTTQTFLTTTDHQLAARHGINCAASFEIVAGTIK